MYDHEVRRLLIEQLQAVPEAHPARNAQLLRILNKNHDEMLDDGDAGLLLRVYRRLVVRLLTNNPDPTLTERLKDAFILAAVDVKALSESEAGHSMARLPHVAPMKVDHETATTPARLLEPKYQFTAPTSNARSTVERTISFAVQTEEFPDNIISLAEVERLFYDELTHGLKLRSWVAVRSTLAGFEPTLFVTARFSK